jgi:hypothetical protein
MNLQFVLFQFLNPSHATFLQTCLMFCAFLCLSFLFIFNTCVLLLSYLMILNLIMEACRCIFTTAITASLHTISLSLFVPAMFTAAN